MANKKKPSRSSSTKTKSSSKKSANFWTHYTRQRDDFYLKHPNSRMLIGLLIVVFAMALGVLYYNKNIVYVGLTLHSQYGIRYPYVDIAKSSY